MGAYSEAELVERLAIALFQRAGLADGDLRPQNPRPQGFARAMLGVRKRHPAGSGSETNAVLLTHLGPQCSMVEPIRT